MSSKGWIGDDGQFYDSWDEWRGANNRYKQQQQQNTLLQEQNELIRQQNEANARREEEEKRKEWEEEFERKREYQDDSIKDLIEKLNWCLSLEEPNSLIEMKKVTIDGIEYVKEMLKDDVDNLIEKKKEIIKEQKTKTSNSNYQKDMDKYWLKILNEGYKEKEQFFIRKINVLEDYLEERKRSNINFCNELYEQLYYDIIEYYKNELRKINQPVNLKKQHNVYDESDRKYYKKVISNNIETIKEIIILIKSFEEKKVKRLEKEQKEFENNIKIKEEQIHKLEEITTLQDLKQIKEKVIDVDYEFSPEIINDLYSINEVILKIKVHIKELETSLLEEKKKEKYYKLIDYLINNNTYTNIQNYEEYNSDIDYEEEYKNVLNYENEQRELEKELQKERELIEQKRLEELKLAEELKKVEELKREEERKNYEDKKKIKVYEESKKYYKLTKWSILLFYIFTLPLAIMLWVEIKDFLIGIGGVIVCIVVGLIFCKLFSPKRKYLKEIKQFGLDNIEDFEKEIIDIQNNKEIEREENLFKTEKETTNNNMWETFKIVMKATIPIIIIVIIIIILIN